MQQFDQVQHSFLADVNAFQPSQGDPGQVLKGANDPDLVLKVKVNQVDDRFRYLNFSQLGGLVQLFQKTFQCKGAVLKQSGFIEL